MKIYFDGCSYTDGKYLGGRRHGIIDWKKKRWSKILANKLGAEEYNFALSGGSNDRIVRNLLVNNNIEEYDLAIIQMTFPVRTEYWDDKWIKVNPKYNFASKSITSVVCKEDEKIVDHVNYWMHYYKHIHNEYYSQIKEDIQYQTIRNHCKVHNVPLVLISNSKGWRSNKKKLPFDMMITNDIYDRISSTDSHPSLDAHSKIADDIINFINITSVL